ncbi:MAG: DUF1080 domain-containing protein [Spirosomataceae bacterium]
MQKSLLLVASLGLLAACSSPKTSDKASTDSTATTTTAPADSGMTALPADEQSAGFSLLFDGKTFANWHTYGKDSTPTWAIANGVLVTKGGNGDLVSNAEYENFELRFDWKVGKGGNSGVMYMIQDEPKKYEHTYFTGPEYQVIDDLGWPDKLDDKQKSGAAYDLYPPLVAAAKPAGEWNTGAIIVNKGHIEHFVNGQKTADYQWNSDDYKKRFEASKFAKWDFAKKYKGHLALQDHGQAVSYRNIRIKTL